MNGILILGAVVLGVPFLLFSLPDSFRFAPRPMHFDDFDGWTEWFKPWHVALAALVFGFLVMELATGPAMGRGVPTFFAVVLVVSVVFLRAWQREFLFLMGLRDDDFPGRLDKAIWAVAMLAFAPVALWVFRTYRLAHWPEPEPKPERDARTAPEAL